MVERRGYFSGRCGGEVFESVILKILTTTPLESAGQAGHDPLTPGAGGHNEKRRTVKIYNNEASHSHIRIHFLNFRIDTKD
jgi:hypothetical protein